MSNDLFIKASRKAYRFPSTRGALATEDLWGMPLTAKNGFSLDAVAIALDTIIRTQSQSFVNAAPTATLAELQAKLEVVQYIIAIRIEEANAATLRAAKTAERRKLLDALEARDNADLVSATREELLAKLAALD